MMFRYNDSIFYRKILSVSKKNQYLCRQKRAKRS